MRASVISVISVLALCGASAAIWSPVRAQVARFRSGEMQSILATEALPKPRAAPFSYSLAIVSAPARYSGPCPTTVRFRALIDSSTKGVQQNDGSTSGFGGLVQFHFERSDGTKGATQQLTFTADKPLVAYDEWAISQSYAGSEKIVVDRPVRPTTGVRDSAPASFQVVCR